jgi:integrase/recombinase XerD
MWQGDGGEGLGKQAKVLTERQIGTALAAVSTRRYPLRDRVVILLSVRAGLRVKEIASIKWSMVTDAEGVVTDAIHLSNGASKGRRGGREIPMAKDLREALVALQAWRPVTADEYVIFSERHGKDGGTSPKALAIWFLALYRDLGFKGASSHSGRRTFITKAAKRCIEAGGSLRDVQQLAGHAGLNTTQRYIEGSSDAKRRIVDLIS